MKVPAFLASIAAMFARQKGPEPDLVGPRPDKYIEPRQSTGTVVFPYTPRARARVNPNPGDGSGYYLAQNHAPVTTLSQRLGRLAGMGDKIESDILNGRSIVKARRKLRPVQYAIAALVARAAHQDKVAARRAA